MNDQIMRLADRIIADANARIAQLNADKDGFVTIPEDRILQREEGRIAVAQEFLDLAARDERAPL